MKQIASSNTSKKTLIEWGDLCICCFKALPDFETYPRLYTLERISNEWTAWVATLKNVIRPILKNLKLFLKRNKKNFRPEQIRELFGHLKLNGAITSYLIFLLKSENWLPDSNAGETTTDNFELIIQLFTTLVCSFKRLFFSLERLGKEQAISNRRNKNYVSSSSLEKTPTISGSKVRKVSYKLNEWQEKELKRLLEKKTNNGSSTHSKIETLNVEIKSNQSLLNGENFGIVPYTIILIGNISKSAFTLLNNNPYDFEVQHLDTATLAHDQVRTDQISHTHYYSFREALLLGTRESINTFEKVLRFFKKRSTEDDSWEMLHNSLIPNIQPILKGGHYYWLLLPKKTKGIVVKNWGLPKGAKIAHD